MYSIQSLSAVSTPIHPSRYPNRIPVFGGMSKPQPSKEIVSSVEPGFLRHLFWRAQQNDILIHAGFWTCSKQFRKQLDGAVAAICTQLDPQTLQLLKQHQLKISARRWIIGGMTYYSRDNTIFVSEKEFKAACAKSPHLTPHEILKRMLLHEMGHAVYFNLALDINPRQQVMLQAHFLQDQQIAKRTYQQLRTLYQQTYLHTPFGYYFPQHKDDSKGFREFFAECFAVDHGGGMNDIGFMRKNFSHSIRYVQHTIRD